MVVMYVNEHHSGLLLENKDELNEIVVLHETFGQEADLEWWYVSPCCVLELHMPDTACLYARQRRRVHTVANALHKIKKPLKPLNQTRATQVRLERNEGPYRTTVRYSVKPTVQRQSSASLSSLSTPVSRRLLHGERDAAC